MKTTLAVCVCLIFRMLVFRCGESYCGRTGSSSRFDTPTHPHARKWYDPCRLSAWRTAVPRQSYNMRIVLSLCLIVYLSKFVCSSFTVVEAIVGKPAVLPCAIVCHGDNNWSRFIPDTTTVARCVSGTCRIGADFKERFTFTGNATRGNISLLISPAVYNDIGSYTCSCGGKTADVKLHVFVPTVVVARELENITLPCYGDTRRDARDAQWQKDGQRVLHYDSKTGTVTHGRGYEERCMLSKGFADGDLSLHIGSVSESDEGIYRCTIHDESREGEPRAVLLKVENNKTDGSLSFGTGVSIGVVITAFTAVSMVLAVYLWRRYKRCQPFQHLIKFLLRS